MIATARRNGTTRYRLLDTIRAFVADQAVAEGEIDHLRSCHAMHYAAVLDELRQALRGPTEADAVVRLDEVWPEVRAAVAWSIQQRRTDVAVHLLAGLGFEAVFRERGEIVGWADEALALPGVEDDERADELLGTAGLADWGFGRFDRGLERAERAVSLHRERGTRIALTSLRRCRCISRYEVTCSRRSACCATTPSRPQTTVWSSHRCTCASARP